MSTPLELVEHQLAAYNDRNLERFLEVFSDDIEVTRLPGTVTAIVGKAALAKFYGENRFSLPALHAEIVNRIVMGSKIVDHERITGIGPEPIEIIVTYAVENGAIRRMWSLTPDA